MASGGSAGLLSVCCFFSTDTVSVLHKMGLYLSFWFVGFLITNFILCMSVSVVCPHAYMCTKCMLDALRSQKRASCPLAPGLQMVVSPVSGGN